MKTSQMMLTSKKGKGPDLILNQEKAILKNIKAKPILEKQALLVFLKRY